MNRGRFGGGDALANHHGFIPADPPGFRKLPDPATQTRYSDEHLKKDDISPMSVGRDSGLTLKTRRGTGCYKVPSLKSVWYRGMFGHSGWRTTLADWFDSRRVREDYIPTCSLSIRNSRSGDRNLRNRSTAPDCHAICCHPAGNSDANTFQFSLAIQGKARRWIRPSTLDQTAGALSFSIAMQADGTARAPHIASAL